MTNTFSIIVQRSFFSIAYDLNYVAEPARLFFWPNTIF